MLVMVVFFITFRWIHLSTPLIRLFLLVLILILMPTLNFLPGWFALSLLRFRLPSRLPMMFILWMVFFFQAEDGIRDKLVTGVQTCALPILRRVQNADIRLGPQERVKRRIPVPHIAVAVPRIRPAEQDAEGTGGRDEPADGTHTRDRKSVV